MKRTTRCFSFWAFSRFILCVVISLSLLWSGYIVSNAVELDGLDWYSTTSQASFVHNVVSEPVDEYYTAEGNTRMTNKKWIDHFSFALYFPFSTVSQQIFIYDQDAVLAGFAPGLTASWANPYENIEHHIWLSNVTYTWSFMCNGKESAIPDISSFWVVGPEFTGASMQMYIKCIVELDLEVLKTFNPTNSVFYYDDKINLNMSLRMVKWQHNQFTSPYTALKAQLASIDAKLADGGGSAQIVNKLDQQIQQQHQDAEAQLTESQKQTSIQEEHKNTTKGIFSKISEFFAGFFDGITNSLLSLFVPDDDYFSDFFSRLNAFFEEKLGMLYIPIGLFVDLLSALGSASGEFAGIQFPGVKWEDTYLIEPQLVNFTVIPGLQEKIYFITDVIMVGGILWLLQIKMKEVLSG